MSGPEERQRAMELYFTTPMTTAQVVEHLGYPTRQCRERWLAKDPRYAGRMRSPIIPLETRRKAIEPASGGMTASSPGNGNAAQDGGAPSRPRRDDPGDDGDVEAPRRRVGESELGNALMREVAEVVKKKTPAPT